MEEAEWKILPLEIAFRAFYGIALITGVIIMNVHGIVSLAVIHRASAALFLALLSESAEGGETPEFTKQAIFEKALYQASCKAAIALAAVTPLETPP